MGLGDRSGGPRAPTTTPQGPVRLVPPSVDTLPVSMKGEVPGYKGDGLTEEKNKEQLLQERRTPRRASKGDLGIERRPSSTSSLG